MTTVFLSGSRKITNLNDVIKERIESEITAGSAIVVGDANGADKAMQTLLADRGYSNVAVYYAGETCRNNIGSWQSMSICAGSKLKGRALYTEKDKAMARLAGYGIVLWDGISAGSITNVFELLKHNKKADVYVAFEKRFLTVEAAQDIKEILLRCDPSTIADFENSAFLKHQMENLGLARQGGLEL